MKFYSSLIRLLLAIVLLSATTSVVARQASESQTAFFVEIKKLCGQSFAGATESHRIRITRS